jgi:hypothetical protein
MKNEELSAIIEAQMKEGMGANDIREFLLSEHDVNKTNRDIKFIMADFAVVKTKEKPKPKVEEAESLDAVNKISVKSHISPIQDYLMSGDVTFNSGVKGFWYVERGGFLGIDVSEEKITKDDLHDLHSELEKIFK